jgi:hypothetical protein
MVSTDGLDPHWAEPQRNAHGPLGAAGLSIVADMIAEPLPAWPRAGRVRRIDAE